MVNMSPATKNKAKSKVSLHGMKMHQNESFSTITVAQARNAYMNQQQNPWDDRSQASPSPLRLPGIKHKQVASRKYSSNLPSINEPSTTAKIGKKFLKSPNTHSVKLPPATQKHASIKTNKGMNL